MKYKAEESTLDMFLTRDTDKLAALSGLAKQVQPSLSSKYIAGIWVENFSSSLLWQVVPGRVHRRPSRYRGPTWSWISLDGPIKYPSLTDHSNEDGAKLINSSVVPVDKDPMVQLLSASLVLSGYLGIISYWKEFRIGRKVLYQTESHLDTLGEFVYDIESEVPPDQSIFFFCIFSDISYPGPNSFLGKGSGLALAKVEGEVNHYRRLGIVTGIATQWFKSHPRSVITII
jgi:hypothetical protein